VDRTETVVFPPTGQGWSWILAFVLLLVSSEGRMKAATDKLVIDDAPHILGASRLKILVVDHDPEQLESVSSWCDAWPDVHVVGYSSAEEALTQSGGDSFDLCLLDYGLDGVDGVMLGAMIRALNPGAQMVLMARSLNPAITRQAVEHGFQRVVSKPLDSEMLEDIIRL
jgi:CheY-like chemotaxis protein